MNWSYLSTILVIAWLYHMALLRFFLATCIFNVGKKSIRGSSWISDGICCPSFCWLPVFAQVTTQAEWSSASFYLLKSSSGSLSATSLLLIRAFPETMTPPPPQQWDLDIVLFFWPLYCSSIYGFLLPLLYLLTFLHY